MTGIDLIKEQIRIAAGMALSWRQQDVKISGHSIECRINAECPDTFTPSPGRITRCQLPGGPGVRIDTAIESGSEITPHYDSLIAKLIVRDQTREEALARMRRALNERIIEGIKTTIPLHRRVLDDPDFQKGRFSTAFLERFMSAPASS